MFKFMAKEGEARCLHALKKQLKEQNERLKSRAVRLRKKYHEICQERDELEAAMRYWRERTYKALDELEVAHYQLLEAEFERDWAEAFWDAAVEDNDRLRHELMGPDAPPATMAPERLAKALKGKKEEVENQRAIAYETGLLDK